MSSTLKKARRRTSDRVLDKIVSTNTDGQLRIVDEPPIMVHAPVASMDAARRLMVDYLRTVRADIAILLSQFELVDVAVRIVGVGSVGTRCYIMLLIGPSGEPLFLQAKEVPPSVIETYGGIPSDPPRSLVDIGPGFQGYRVISCQRTLQTVSDPFLGYIHDGGIDFYIREFRDMKGSLDLTSLNALQFREYSELCGALLGRAHAQSLQAGFVTGYLTEVFDEAIVGWSTSYAAQVERDFDALVAANRSGRMPVETGV